MKCERGIYHKLQAKTIIEEVFSYLVKKKSCCNVAYVFTSKINFRENTLDC